MSDDFFAPPAFKPAEARVTLRRALRALGLAERSDGLDWKGQPVVRLPAPPVEGEAVLAVSLARRPARSPEWDAFELRDSAGVRRFLDEARRRVARWGDAD